MLKVEGIAFRFLPDPVQIKNALDVSFLFYQLSIAIAFCHIGPFHGILQIFQHNLNKFLSIIYSDHIYHI